MSYMYRTFRTIKPSFFRELYWMKRQKFVTVLLYSAKALIYKHDKSLKSMLVTAMDVTAIFHICKHSVLEKMNQPVKQIKPIF